MTIVTKPITDKKSDKLEQPLVDNEINESLPTKVDLEATAEPEPQYLLMRARARRVSTATTVCLFLTALIVMSIGIIGGVFLYRQFARSQMHRFHGVCNIPYGTKGQLKYDSLVGHSELKMPESGFDLYEDIRQNGLKEHRPRQYAGEFKEEFELDLNFDIYEKIEIPDFKDGRRGRFIHDFNANKTGIIDLDGNRCFVMPLNRYQVLPPRSLFDLIKKMWEGYYEVDTKVVRETMRVTIPPLSDMQGVGQYISRECMGMPTYKLQKVTRPIFKRSVTEDLPDNAKFAEFAGRNVVEFDIINFEELLSFEAGQTKRSDVVAPVVEGDSSTKAGQSQDEEVGKNRGE